MALFEGREVRLLKATGETYIEMGLKLPIKKGTLVHDPFENSIIVAKKDAEKFGKGAWHSLWKIVPGIYVKKKDTKIARKLYPNHKVVGDYILVKE